MSEIESRAVDTLRFLAVDMVEAARSGHPGLPLGAAPMAYVLWQRFLRHNPANPHWPGRDRFILSAGHGSALLYALLHLSGYPLSVDELRRFRQWGSRTPGHPEAELTEGVEVTTGPLGQGFGMGVGMAIAERYLAHTFDRPGFPLVDHWTYGIVSDGDLMEGVGAEAASLAGTMGLGRLLYLYDSNAISLEGETRLSFTEDVGGRFESYGWSVSHIEDGNDLPALEAAIRTARADERRPHLLIVRTHIGFGSPKQDTKEAHGEPLGGEATAATKRRFNWPLAPTFLVPEDVRAHFREAAERGPRLEKEWEDLRRGYREKYPELSAEFDRACRGELPPGWSEGLPSFRAAEGELASRDASARVLRELARRIPTLIGGSADLAPSTKTLLPGEESFLGGRVGRNLHFGVREHAMAAALNGMAMHGGLLPYGSTFLVFSDYARAAIRIGALMRAHVLYLFTHDSVALGEDGPTHQPVEQLWSLRAIPGVTLFRPADANETALAWEAGLARPGPVLFALTRQKLPVLDPDRFPMRAGVGRGGYVLSPGGSGAPELVLLATGSEVHLALAAQRELASNGRAVRVVSLPSVELFDEQEKAYRDSVLPPGIPRLAIEAGSPLGWWKYVGERGDVIGVSRFGASAPGPVVLEKLGFSVENVLQRARSLLASGREGR